MFNKIKTILAVAVTYSIVISSAYSDAITDLAKVNLVFQLFLKKKELKN